VDYWKMCLSILIFTFGANTTVLRHITVVKCVQGSPTIILDAWLPAGVKVEFLAYTFNCLQCSQYILWEYLKTIVCAHRINTKAKLWFRIQLENETKKTPKILEPLRVIFNVELYWVSVNTRVIKNTYFMKAKIIPF
jgi:hypothetical protein